MLGPGVLCYETESILKSRTLLRHCCHFSNYVERNFVLSTKSKQMTCNVQFVSTLRKDEISRKTCWTLLPKTATKSNVASTLLLAWTGFKIAKRRITQITLYDSPETLALLKAKTTAKFQWSHPQSGRQIEIGYVKIGDFRRWR